MAETRKNHLIIDGGQVKEDDHPASYKPIPESDSEFRTSKASINKSKEKLSADGAEEKLLQKEEEAKIVTRVDMAEAKYVVGDHRNGDAKIELDANKRQFSGLTKEELMKYAEDPFWVRLRWFMFVLFWALWLAMLAGAIVIIVQAPKCALPPSRTWYEKGPIVDMSSAEGYGAIEPKLEMMQSSKVAGVFTFACKDAYEVLETTDTGCIQQFKEFAAKAKDYGVKVIVDLTANFVSSTHKWFHLSENRSAEYNDYFVWAPAKDYDSETNAPIPPFSWRSTLDEAAWSWSETRKEFYLHQFRADQPDLDFSNTEVVKKFGEVIKIWMDAGAQGIRLHNARELIVNITLKDKNLQRGPADGSDHTQHQFWKPTRDAPALDMLLEHWAHLAGDALFTIVEEQETELFLLDRNTSALRPPSTAPLQIRSASAPAAAASLNKRLGRWPLLQLVDEDDSASAELAAFAMLLPAAPVLAPQQLKPAGNDTLESELLSRLVALREDETLQHGQHRVGAVPAHDTMVELLACIRWKDGHASYAGVYNPGAEPARADLSGFSVLPAQLTVYHASRAAKQAANFTTAVQADDVLVPAKSTLILAFVPKTATVD